MNVLGMILVAAATLGLIYVVQRKWAWFARRPSYRFPVSVVIAIVGLFLVLVLFAKLVNG